MRDARRRSIAEADGPAIEVGGLVKRYGRRTAVDGLELRVEPGEVFGFLGPNGAGKTTTVRMLLGLARPTGGRGQVLGRPLGDPEARRQVGYLPENVHFPGWFTAMGFLRYHGALYGLSRRAIDARAEEALERLGLGGRGNDRLRSYSHGMLQRLGLAQALLNEPRLVFLDEPTSALDPRGRREVRELLIDLRARGTTVFLNSHLLSEVERTCNRVAIVAHGTTRYLGPTHPEIEAPRELDVRLQDPPEDMDSVLAGVARVKRSDGGGPVAGYRLELAAPDAAPEVARRLLEAGARLHELTPAKRELEDLFLELTSAPARPEGDGPAALAAGKPGRDGNGSRLEDGSGRGPGRGGRRLGTSNGAPAPNGNGAASGNGAPNSKGEPERRPGSTEVPS